MLKRKRGEDMRSKPADVPFCGVDEARIEQASPSLDPVNLRRLRQFITARYRVHIRKDVKGLPAPWTSNKIISQYKFTNVRREHDRQSRYLIENISRNQELSLEDKIVNTFYFRAWNNWETMRDLGGPWDARVMYSPALKEKVRPRFKQLEADEPERKWWSSAYNQGGTKHAWKFPAGDGYQRAYKESEARKYVDWEPDIPLRVFHIGPWLKSGQVVERLLNAKDQQEAFEVIRSVRGFADFLAYQVFVDLTYIEEFPFSENEFTVAGPGCKKGLDLLFTDYDGLTHEEALFWLREHVVEEFNKDDSLANEWDPVVVFADLPKWDRRLNVMSLENCFCELSKYVRAAEGTGRPRVKYKPQKAREVAPW